MSLWMPPKVSRGTFLAIATAAAVVALPGTAEAANTAKVSVNCAPNSLSPGTVATCVATVTDTGSAATRQPPSGTVTYTLENGSTGTFDPDSSCDLEPSGAFSSKCTVSYTPATINGGEHDLLATYGGGPAHGRATTRLALEVTPANDETDNATRISLPAKLTGTTEGATWGDDPELCGDAWAPVWYSLKSAEKARLAVRLTVKGRVDSVIAVFRLDRSKFTSLGCNLTDSSGVAGLSFDVQRGGSYLVAVSAPWDARTGSFLLEAAKVPPIGLAGSLLRHDARVSLDPLLRPGAAFTLRLKQGETIKVNAVPSRGSCMEVAILRPGARSEADILKASERCEGYLVFTPNVDGWALYPLVVRFADASSGKPTATAEDKRPSSWRPTDLQIHMRRAGSDDRAPGVLLHNGKMTSGALAAGMADAVDVYRFRLTGTRDAIVWARGTSPSDLLLLGPTGTTVACACEGAITATIAKRLGRGTFFAVVRGRPGSTGRYHISVRLRMPTKIAVRWAGAGAGHGTARATVSPVAGGRVVFELQQFDPLSGWYFSRSMKRSLQSGKTWTDVPIKQGRWRMRARYMGSLGASPSTSGWMLIPGR